MLKKLVEVNAGGGGDHWDEFWYEKAQSDKAGVTIDIIKTIGYWWTNPGSGPYSRDTALAQWRAETNMETNQSGQNGQKRKADEIATPTTNAATNSAGGGTDTSADAGVAGTDEAGAAHGGSARRLC